MITYIKGILISVHPDYAVVDVNGIGYAIYTSCRLLGELPSIGQIIQFHTSFIVREASHTLYGFLKSEERELFELLMNVSGVGPKLSLSMIGHLTLSELQIAVASQDLPTLCRVPGVGKKTAERLVVELKDKLPNLIPHAFTHMSISVSQPTSSVAQDAILALMNLGYNQHTAQKAIKQSMKDLPEEVDLSLLITAALQNVNR